MSKHTLASVKADLKHIVESQGREEFVYKRQLSSGTCAYNHGNKPGCIIGHWFKLHGYKVPKDYNTGAGVDRVLHQMPEVFVADTTKKYMERVQQLQDGGEPWGVAIKGGRR